MSQLLPKTSAASERLARLRKQGAQLAALGMTDKVADNRKQQDTQAARIQVRAGCALKASPAQSTVHQQYLVRKYSMGFWGPCMITSNFELAASLPWRTFICYVICCNWSVLMS